MTVATNVSATCAVGVTVVLPTGDATPATAAAIATAYVRAVVAALGYDADAVVQEGAAAALPGPPPAALAVRATVDTAGNVRIALAGAVTQALTVDVPVDAVAFAAAPDVETASAVRAAAGSAHVADASLAVARAAAVITAAAANLDWTAVARGASLPATVLFVNVSSAMGGATLSPPAVVGVSGLAAGVALGAAAGVKSVLLWRWEAAVSAAVAAVITAALVARRFRTVVAAAPRLPPRGTARAQRTRTRESAFDARTP